MTDQNGSPRTVTVCRADALVENAAVRVDVEGTPVAVALVDGQVYAIADTCSHADYSLSEGDLDPLECALECPKHGSLFSLQTGEALTLPATVAVATFPVAIRGDEVVVDLPMPGQTTDRASNEGSR